MEWQMKGGGVKNGLTWCMNSPQVQGWPIHSSVAVLAAIKQTNSSKEAAPWTKMQVYMSLASHTLNKVL